MPWNQYGTKDTYASSLTSARRATVTARLSWLVSANYLDSYQQPLTYTTAAAFPAGTTGTFPALNKQGVVADVVGTGALAHSQQASGNFRLAYDVTPLVQATYSLGIWNNVADLQSPDLSDVDGAGLPTLAASGSPATNTSGIKLISAMRSRSRATPRASSISTFGVELQLSAGYQPIHTP